MKTMTLIMLAGLSGVLFAEPVKLDPAGQFGKLRNVSTEGDVITVTGPCQLRFKEKYTIDPNAKYTLSCEIKLPEDAKKALFAGGFIVYDKTGEEIKHQEVMAVPGTETKLTEPVKAGDRVIKIANGAKWEKRSWAYVVFNAKTDVPNKELVKNILSVEQDDGFWTVTLKNPVPKDYPAGTVVREHTDGGYLYTFTVAKPKEEWMKLTGTISGIRSIGAKNRNRQFWPCTVQIQPMLMPNWNFKPDMKDARIQIRNVTFEEVK